ncbi:DUF2635 domain-containing protein [Castellaniella sp. UC4442_H9]
MTRMHVVPVDGRSVPDLDRGGLLAADGREVEKNQYWMRRLVAGDVVIKSAPGRVVDKKKEA